MYEQYDGLKKFENAFTPHPETFDFIPEYSFEFGYVRMNEKEIKPVVFQEEEKDPEPKKEDKSLVVTNNVTYDITDSKAKGIFKRRK